MNGSSAPMIQQAKQAWLRVSSPAMKRLQGVMTSGITPQKLALTLCIGVVVGVMPLVWGTTLICLLLGHVFRLNQVALQSLNYLLYPAQLALLIPFYKLGAWLFPWGAHVPPDILFSLFHTPDWSSVQLIAWITFTSIAAWTVTALPLALLVYGLIRAAARIKHNRSA